MSYICDIVQMTSREGQPHTDYQYSTSTQKQAKQEIKEEPQDSGMVIHSHMHGLVHPANL